MQKWEKGWTYRNNMTVCMCGKWCISLRQVGVVRNGRHRLLGFRPQSRFMQGAGVRVDPDGFQHSSPPVEHLVFNNSRSSTLPVYMVVMLVDMDSDDIFLIESPHCLFVFRQSLLTYYIISRTCAHIYTHMYVQPFSHFCISWRRF